MNSFKAIKNKLMGHVELEVTMAKSEDQAIIEALYKDFSGEHMAEIAVLDKAIVSESIKRMIKDGALILGNISGKTIGFVAGYFQNCHFSNDVMFSLMYFYVHEKYRTYSSTFLKVIEELLKVNTNATKFVVSSPAFLSHEKLDKFYRINGFKLLETHFYKDIIR